MSFRKSVGNMYPWVTHTWNMIKGKCSHDCVYCYMKRFPQGEMHFDEKELKRNLGSDNFIFVGSSCDMFAENVPGEWIAEIFGRCYQYPENKYLFQSKNPARFVRSKDWFSPNMILATTIESDIDYGISNAPSAMRRARAMSEISGGIVTIEPILNFNLNRLMELIIIANPKWVNIGADSKKHNLPEPDWEKVQKLINELKKYTEVRKKSNLERLKK